MATWGKIHGALSIEACMFDSQYQIYDVVGSKRERPILRV